MPTWLRNVGGAVIAVLALAGCSGSPEPTPTTPATASASPPMSASATPDDPPTKEPTETPEVDESGAAVGLPPLPDAAKENTPEGAEAFIRYYFDVANGLYMNPRPGVIPRISDENCVACQRTESTIASLASSNSHARTEPFRIETMDRIGGGVPGLQRFNMVAHAPENATVAADGSESNLGRETALAGIGAAIWNGEQWKLYDLALEPR